MSLEERLEDEIVTLQLQIAGYKKEVVKLREGGAGARTICAVEQQISDAGVRLADLCYVTGHDE